MTDAGRPVRLKIYRDQEAADAVLPLLPKIHSIDNVEVTGVPLTAIQLEAIGKRTSLKLLTLHDCDIDDADLAHLAALKNLQSLRLSANPIEGNGLHHIKDLRELTLLDLGATQVSGPSLEVVGYMPLLSELRLASSKLNDAGVEVLVGSAVKVRSLTAAGTDITLDGYLRLADSVWLTGPSYSYSLVATPEAPQSTFEARMELKRKFKERQQRAIEDARAKGLDTPAFAGAPQ